MSLQKSLKSKKNIFFKTLVLNAAEWMKVLNLIIFITLIDISIQAMAHYPKTDLLVFSYNRPMQLYALLESIERYLTGLDSIIVLTRFSSQRYASAYEIVQKRFPYVKFCIQGANPFADFKPLTLQIIEGGKSPYIIFAVDDIIVKDFADLKHCIDVLENTGAYGFYLRLGKHLTASYGCTTLVPIPKMTSVESTIYSWHFTDGKDDWAYPNTVDMTLYRKNDIIHQLAAISFTNPNSMEGWWAAGSNQIKNKIGLCFDKSIIVNIPLNIVNPSNNPYMNSWSTNELLTLFEHNKKIDIFLLQGILNDSTHINFELQFKER